MKSEMETKYSHEIEFFLKHETLGRLPGKFRTTPDALELHLKVLNERQDRGEVSGVVVRVIAHGKPTLTS